MRTLTASRINDALAGGVALTAVLTAGCASNTVIYDRRANVVPTIAAAENTRVSCKGSIEVFRDHGMFHLIGPGGPWWSHNSFYGIYFKEGPEWPTNFYLSVSPDKMPVQTFGARGSAQIDGRHVVIDVEYKDSSGRWNRPPINGRRKIDSVFPDDLPRTNSEPATK
jgi:hypothetical protein